MNEKQDKKDPNQDQKIRNTLVNRGGTLFGNNTAITGYKPPKRYICSNCGIILGPDLLWKREGNINKPFCAECKIPVEEENKIV